jgi:hypothetical protein
MSWVLTVQVHEDPQKCAEEKEQAGHQAPPGQMAPANVLRPGTSHSG